MRDIKEIIIHCTGTRYIDSCNKKDNKVSPFSIRNDHIKNRGFVDCGYHYIIDCFGEVFCMRPVSMMGAHCRGHNQYSIGIAYLGGLDKDYKPFDSRTPNQKIALINLICVLKSVFGNIPVYGHRDFANKACPCFDATSEYQDIYHSVVPLDIDPDDVDDL